MTSHNESSPSNADTVVGAGNRWRFNTSGQLVDSEAATAGWDLADEIVRLKIGEVAGDSGDDVPIRTPPKAKLASAVLNEASPLDTSSNPSVDSSPQASDHQIISHSRGSSTDTTVSSSQESALSAASNTMLPQNTETVSELKERPHSFSGGLSSADLRRLQLAGESNGVDTSESPFHQQQQQHQQWASVQYRENDRQLAPEQLSYPSLTNHAAAVNRPHPQQSTQPLYDYRSAPAQNGPNRDDLQIDYSIQQRNFNPLPQGHGMTSNVPAPPSFTPGRPNNAPPALQYRQPPRGFPQQGLLPSPTTMGYPAHTSHLSLGNAQQLYDMMLPGQPLDNHPAVTRVQQQHNVFRGAHHHSASDPSSAMRDAATLALLSNNMQGFAPGMFPQAMPPPAMAMYSNQYYGAQDPYPRPDVAQAQAMAARLQSQYTGTYGILPQPTGMGMGGDGSLSPSSTGQGPSANNRKLGLYKTELCRSWEEKGTCRYGGKCQFAHGEDELRKVSRHPKVGFLIFSLACSVFTNFCCTVQDGDLQSESSFFNYSSQNLIFYQTFWVSGSCPYGKRCCFIHTELPTSGAAAGGTATTENTPQPPQHDGRARSLSTNSDPNEASVSLLARLAKRNPDGANGSNASTPVDGNNGFQFTRPPTGSLRVDTSTLDGALKQNKSAYPTFASNGVLLPAPEHIKAKDPAPVTAGPDLGRHNNSRLDIVGYNQVGRLQRPLSLY